MCSSQLNCSDLKPQVFLCVGKRFSDVVVLEAQALLIAQAGCLWQWLSWNVCPHERKHTGEDIRWKVLEGDPILFGEARHFERVASNHLQIQRQPRFCSPESRDDFSQIQETFAQ